MALPVLPGGVMKGFQKFLLTIVNNSLETQSNFNAEQALHSIIDGANLAEFKVGEGCFKQINECYKEE